jgi:PIN domain nuclease of toxin-antitoxin system
MAETRYLLDTCAAIWMVEGSRISQSAIDAISEAVHSDTPLFVSPITAWERGLLVSKGRIASPISPKAWFGRLVGQEAIELAEMSPDILTDSSFLPQPIHNDPADRIIIATARAHDLTIVTRDTAILDYADRGHVRALAC